MLMRGLDNKKGVDIMVKPSTITRSGQRATFELIEEFIYPSEYEPPELPNSVGLGVGDDGDLIGGAAAIFLSAACPKTVARTTSMKRFISKAL